jgi:GR25 family glycosyltransferase involved in LPS biosynthesis
MSKFIKKIKKIFNLKKKYKMKQNLKKIVFIFFLIIIILTLLYFSFYTKRIGYKYNGDDFNRYKNLLKKIDYGIPKNNFKIPMYYINLEKSKDRNDAMLKQKKKYNLPLERVDAVNGYEFKDTKNDSFFITPGQKINFLNMFPDIVNIKPLIGCTLSHIKAIYTALEHNDDLAIIMEDDTSLITYNHWSEKLEKIIKKAPPSWRIINLYHFCHNKLGEKFISNKQNTCASASCYIINNKGMRELIDLVKINNTIVLKKTEKAKEPDADVLAADFFLYNLVETYHYNGKLLIFPNIKLQSTIHVEDYEFQLNSVVKKIKKFLFSKKNLLE